MALLALVLFSATFFRVTANDIATKRNCKGVLWTAMRQTCNSKCSNHCVKNGSNVTIWLKRTEREYNVILVMSNHTECRASVLRDTKAKRITEWCNATSFKHCNVTKKIHVEIRVAQELKEIGREEMKQGASSRFKKGFKTFFKLLPKKRSKEDPKLTVGTEKTRSCPYCSDGQCNVFIIRRKENGSISMHACFMLGTECRTKQDLCKCSVENVFKDPALEANNESNFNNDSRLAPKINEEEGIDRKTLNHSNETFCFVLLCLLLEVLVYVVFHLSLGRKCRRTESYDLVNATSNPSYQQGLQLPHSSDTSQCPDPVADRETYQPPYQPLVANTRGPGVITQYSELTEEREKEHRINPIDPASYQDLVQNREDGSLNLEGLTHGEVKGEPLYCVPEESVPIMEDPRDPSGSPRDPLYNVLKELKGVISLKRVPSSDSLGEPFYYVLEESAPTEKNPRSPRQRSNSFGSLRDSIVLKEPQGLIKPDRAPSSDSHGDPIYYVLEESVAIEKDPRRPRRRSYSTGFLGDPYVLKEPQRGINPKMAPSGQSSDSPGEPIYYVLENPEDTEARDTEDENI